MSGRSDKAKSNGGGSNGGSRNDSRNSSRSSSCTRFWLLGFPTRLML